MPGASATHTSWQPWLRTTSRRRTLAWDQFSEISTHINQIPHAEPAPRTQKVAGMRGNTAVKIKKQRYWSAKIGRKSNQACVQYRARCKALPKARLKPEGERAAEMTAAERVRSGQRIQGAMRQQPCAPNTGQPQQLAATIVEHRRPHAEGSWSPRDNCCNIV